MKILHICLASAFTEGMTYQDNLIAAQNAKDGHNVILISDCHKYIDGTMVYTPPEDSVLSDGIRLIRLEYDKIINSFISGKIRKVSKLYNIVVKYKPDVILFHGVAGWELRTVAKYKKNNPNCKLYLDSHEDFYNSATNILSRIVQYKWFNRCLVNMALPYVNKIFCVSYECFAFLKQLYGVPDEKMEFYPLGGYVFDDSERKEKRDKIRKELKIEDDDILIIHSGKFDKLKRTEDIFSAFTQVPDERLKLVLIGSMGEAAKNNLERLILLDERVEFLGWKNSDELLEYLCACDLYVQPGSQSATMQNALCCECAVAVYPHPSHKYLLNDSVFYVETIEDMTNLFKNIIRDYGFLARKKCQGYKIAQENLDYRILAKRLYK